jgi:hypothetical protein
MSKEIGLTNGGAVIVDDWNYDWLNQWEWQRSPQGYAYRCDRGKTIAMHTLIVGVEKGKDIDHIDLDKLNNQEYNLRSCTRSQNMANRKKIPGSSKYKGVYRTPKCNRWTARITYQYKGIHLGLFIDEIDAAKAYDKKAKELFGEFARTNFG